MSTKYTPPMSAKYTPTKRARSIGEIEDVYVTYRHITHGVLREDGRAEFRSAVATVTPNPDDARQASAVTRVLHDEFCLRCAWGDPEARCFAGDDTIARAVLTALTAMGGDR